MTGVGAQIKAIDNLSIKAAGDIDFKGLSLPYFTETKGFSVGFTYPGSSLVQPVEKGSLDPIINSMPLLASAKGLLSGGGGALVSGIKLAGILGGGIGSFDGTGSGAPNDGPSGILGALILFLGVGIIFFGF